MAAPLRSAPRICVVGSSNTDLIARLDRLPRPGETRSASTFTTAAGGKGANQAVAAARAGGRVSFVARLGRDAYGDAALKGFRQEGLNVRHVSRDDQHPSGVALIWLGPRGVNSIAVVPGANAQLTSAHVDQAQASLLRSQVVLLQLESPLPTVERAAQLAHEAGIPVVLNPAPAQRLPGSLLRRITCLTPNETEAAYLTGLRVHSWASADRAARRLRERGPTYVIITLGARGVFVSGPDLHQPAPGIPVEAVDTVAAGDVFNGALAVAWAEGRPILEAVNFAQAAAAISVTRPGAQSSAPTRREILRTQANALRRGRPEIKAN
ncbi:MAG: ribokinase [Verrucomicrobia bacterium]|nr:ribokinase [Verrucomicrobiota bacterium]